VPDWWPTLLLVVFVTHGPFFAWRWWRTREARFLATTITFALLAATYGLRVFAPDAVLAGAPLYWWLRVPAWLSAAVSIGLLIRHRIARPGARGVSCGPP
jgi:hypothetical protein